MYKCGYNTFSFDKSKGYRENNNVLYVFFERF